MRPMQIFYMALLAAFWLCCLGSFIALLLAKDKESSERCFACMLLTFIAAVFASCILHPLIEPTVAP